MKNFLQNIKGGLTELAKSKPIKILKTAAYIAGGLMALSGLLNVFTYTVTAFKSFSKALFS